MGTVTTLPRGRAFTRRDLDAMPDDGRRHELVDGTLIVTPAPSMAHQTAVGELHLLLRRACPEHLKVMLSPFDVALAANTVVEPDLLVARRSDLTDRDLPAAPVLAVEVVSHSTRRVDLTLKRSLFESAGCPSYWVVDTDAPSLTAWELQEGRYVEVARATAEETFTTSRPFDLTITPAELRD